MSTSVIAKMGEQTCVCVVMCKPLLTNWSVKAAQTKYSSLNRNDAMRKTTNAFAVTLVRLAVFACSPLAGLCSDVMLGGGHTKV